MFSEIIQQLISDIRFFAAQYLIGQPMQAERNGNGYRDQTDVVKDIRHRQAEQSEQLYQRDVGYVQLKRILADQHEEEGDIMMDMVASPMNSLRNLLKTEKSSSPSCFLSSMNNTSLFEPRFGYSFRRLYDIIYDSSILYVFCQCDCCAYVNKRRYSVDRPLTEMSIFSQFVHISIICKNECISYCIFNIYVV